jgi:hypothetical protein
MGMNYEVTQVKELLLINGIKRFGRMSDHITATLCFVAWLVVVISSCLFIIRAEIYDYLHDGIKEGEVEVGRDVTRLSEMRKTCKTLDGKPERKTSHGRPRRRREDNSEIYVKGVGFDEFVCIQRACDGSSGRSLASWKFRDRLSRCIALHSVELLSLLLLILLCYSFC